MLYENPMMSLATTGYKSQCLHIHRGTWQGCPLSSVLFILAIEPPGIKICATSDNKSIQCGDREHKCALFAVYILMLISSPITTISNLLATLQHSSATLGLSVNRAKSLAMNLSLYSHSRGRKKRGYFTYFGIHLTPSLLTLYHLIYPLLY